MTANTNTHALWSERFWDVVSNLPMTAKQIGKRVGVSYRTVEGWRARKSIPSADAVMAMAREFDEVWDVMKGATRRVENVSEAEQILADLETALRERRRNGS